MNKLPRLLLFFLFLAMGMTAQQTASVSGSVQTTGQPVPSIIVVLLSAEAKAVVKTEITDESGAFLFSGIPFGTYIVSIDDPGFKPYESSAVTVFSGKPGGVVPVIALQKSEVKALDEVAVIRKKPIVENKIDKVVVNVDAMLTAAGGDAMDVLEKSPGIMVDQNGTITFKGKSGVAVFIDGKPTYMSGADLESYLKSLPAATLNQIELMTNPPAKYDAAGGGGVINIVTKKSNARGFNGSVSSRVAQGKRFRDRQNLNLNYLGDKVRLFGYAGYEYSSSFNDLTIYRRFKDDAGNITSYFDQRSLLENKANGGSARAGIDYYLSNKTTIGAVLFGLRRTGNSQSDVNSVIRNAAMQLDSTVVAQNRSRTPFSNLTFNLNLRHEFSETSKWTVDADYLKYDTEANQGFHNWIYNPDGTLKSEDELWGKLPSDIDIISLKTDYSKQFRNGMSFDTGYKSSFSKTDNIADYRDVVGSVLVPNGDMSNHFLYDETIHAAYVNGSANAGRFSFQAGLRMENTDSKGHQLNNPAATARFRRNYTNLFPTLYVQYKLDSIGNNTLVTSYGKRINRPYYEDLNPFVSPLDKFTYYTGNPYLNPTFSHNIELSYRYKSFFSTTASYGFSHDDIAETIEITDDKTYYSRPGNIGESRFYSLNMNAQIPFAKWYNANIYTELTHSQYKSRLYTETLDTSGTFCVFNMQNAFTFSKEWSGEVSCFYQSDVVSTQFILLSRGGVHLAVQKKILHGKGSLKLVGNDIFYNGFNSGIINNLKNTNAHWVNKPDSRLVSLIFSYSFGKSFQNPKAYDANGADSEKNRVKG